MSIIDQNQPQADDLAARLRLMAQDRETLDVAQFQFIGLEEIQNAYGDRWPANRARIFSIAESFLKRRVDGCDLLISANNGFLVVFDGASRAVQCGLAMTSAARDMGIAVRVGVHTGEVEVVGENVRGVAVHAAARVMSAAGPGDVVVSTTTRDLLEGSGLRFEDAGSHELKGLPGARTLFRVAPASGANA